MFMDNVLSNIIDSYAKLKDLGIHVDASKIEERSANSLNIKVEINTDINSGRCGTAVGLS